MAPSADIAGVSERPLLLNEKFKVHSYDGGSFKSRAQYDVKNILVPTLDPFHCSSTGTKFNLVLKCTEDFTLTHFYISGPGPRCTEPIRSGLVWVTDEPPELSVLKKFDNMSSEEVLEVMKGLRQVEDSSAKAPEPCVYFTTDPTTRESETELTRFREGRYVAIKFLDTHKDQVNIDVGIVALIGYYGRHAAMEHEPLGPWIHRTSRRPWVHPHPLKSMFSSSGWVCDGRDFTGGCRSGQTDFHQTNVYTVTFRCTASGFDLCEKCAYDPSLGKVTDTSLQADLEALADPARSKLAVTRLQQLWKKDWPALLPCYFEHGLLDVLIQAFRRSVESAGRPDEERALTQRQQGPEAQKRQVRRALVQLMGDLAQHLLGVAPGGDFGVNDLVWALCPEPEQHWEEGRIIQLPKAWGGVADEATRPAPPAPPGAFGGSGEAAAGEAPSESASAAAADSNVVDANCFLISWRDGHSPSQVQAGNVWKMTADEDVMMATSGLFLEVQKGAECDMAKVEKHLKQGADLGVGNGEGTSVLHAAVQSRVPAEIFGRLLESGACPEISARDGATPMQLILRQRRENPGDDDLLSKYVDLLVAHGAAVPDASVPLETRIASLRDTFGLKMVGALVTIVSPSTLPVEVLEVLHLLLRELPMPILKQALEPQAYRALTALLQHCVGGTDSFSVAAMGCQIMRALFARPDADPVLQRLVRSHGAARWAQRLACSKDVAQWGLYRQPHHDKMSVEELSREARALLKEMAAARGVDVTASEAATSADVEESAWLENGPLVEIAGSLDEALRNSESGLDQRPQVGQDTLLSLRELLKKTEKGSFGDERCAAYELEQSGIPGLLLRFLKQHAPAEVDHLRNPSVNMDRFGIFRDAFSEQTKHTRKGLARLMRALHAVIETGEAFPVWRHRKERGLRALTEPLSLKLTPLELAGGQASPLLPTALQSQITVPVEPLAPIGEIIRHILRITPCVDEQYLAYCYRLVGGSICDASSGNKHSVVAFEVMHGELPLPIHTIRCETSGETQRVLLAMREYSPTFDPAASDPVLDFRVALCKLHAMGGMDSYQGLLDLVGKNLRGEPAAPPTPPPPAEAGDGEAEGGDKEKEKEKESEATLAKREAAQQFVHHVVASAGGRVGEALAALAEEVQRLAPSRPANTEPEGGGGSDAVDPTMRVHTVMIAVSEEIPFELFWPMVRDDIMGAVRELQPRAMTQVEDAVQAGVKENGMGPIAQRLTLEEAEMLAARVGHVVQTAVTVDPQAVQDVQKERAKVKPGDEMPIAGRVQFAPKGGNSWSPGVIVNRGPIVKGAEPRFDIIDDRGLLWERIPRAKVRLPAQRREAASASGTPIQAMLSQSDLMRIREHLRRRQEEWAERHANLGSGAGGAPGASGAGPASGAGVSGAGGVLAGLAATISGAASGAGDSDRPAASRPTSAPVISQRQRAASSGAIDAPRARRGLSSDLLWSREGSLGEVHFIDDDALGDEDYDDDDGDDPREGDEGDEDDDNIPPLEPSEAGDSQADAMPPRLSVQRDGESRGDEAASSIEEELRVLEQLRAMEQIISEVLDPQEGLSGGRARAEGAGGAAGAAGAEDFLSAPTANLRIRMTGAGGEGQTYQIRRSGGSRGSERAGTAGGASAGASNGYDRCVPLRGDFPCFSRAADSTNPTSSLDHPVVERLGAADLVDEADADEPMEPVACHGGPKATSLSVRFVLQPPPQSAASTANTGGQEAATESSEPIALPLSWNLLKAMQFLQDQRYLRSQASAEQADAAAAMVGTPPCVVQALQKVSLEHWSLGYTVSAFPPSPEATSQGAPMEVDAVGRSPAPSSAAGSNQMPAKKRRRVLSTGGSDTAQDEIAREMYSRFAEELSGGGDSSTGPHRLIARCGDSAVVADAVELMHLLRAHNSALGIEPALWISSKLDRKLRYQLEDPMSVVSGTLPIWATILPRLCPFLFSLKTRKMLLKYTAFGSSFAVHWMQENKVGSLLRRRATVQTELNAQTDPRKIQELSQELSNIEEHVVRSSFWLGTLQSTLVRMQKGDCMLRQSDVAMELVASSGHLVEVQFDGETGFGSAVTQSFYVEVAQALQNRDLNKAVPMWVEDDDSSSSPFLLCRRGLLIRPLVEGPQLEEVVHRFRFLGRLMGQALREGFIVPLPLAEDFFALVVEDSLGPSSLPHPGGGTAGELVGILADFAADLAAAEAAFVAAAPGGRSPEEMAAWRQEQGSRQDFGERFLTHTEGTASQPLSFDQYVSLVGASFLETAVSGAPLCPGGDGIAITIDNLNDFVQKAMDFWFKTGVAAQVEAFRSGLNEVFPHECLGAFSRTELREMFCGEDRIDWDEQALLSHFHPIGGLTSKSPNYKFLIAELLEMGQADRSRFLDFVSSCPRLPPGGLAKFHVDVFPDTTATKQGFPRSRACANQLYLPPYTSKDELHERLHEAMHCSFGHHEQRVRDQ